MWALHCTQGQWDVTAQPLRPSLLLYSAARPNALLRLSENQTPQTSWGWKNLSKSSQTNQILHVQPMPVVCLTTEMELPSPEPVTPKFHGREGFQSCYLPWTTGLNQDRTALHGVTQGWVQPIQAVAHPSSWESLLSTEATATLILRHGNSEHRYSACGLALLLATSLLQKRCIMENKVTQRVTYLNQQQTVVQLLEKT